MRLALSFALLTLLTLPLAAQRGGGTSEGRPRGLPGTGNPNDPLPPWRFVEKDAPPVTAPLVLYWLPSSNKEMDSSPLLTSAALRSNSERCVKLEAIVPPNPAIAGKLGVTGRLPAAVLVDGHGAMLAHLDSSAGTLRPAAVEQMVNAAVGARDDAMFHDIKEAKRSMNAGDKPVAIQLYQRIWDDRCLFPLAGQEAQSALKTLGVVVVEPPSPTLPDPNLTVTPPPPARTTTRTETSKSH